MAISIDEIRINIPELIKKDQWKEYEVSNKTIEICLQRAKEIVNPFIEDTISDYKILVIFLTQHLCIMNLPQLLNVSIYQKNERWAEIKKEIGFDQTIPGQQFKALIRKYTTEFENVEELSNLPQHFLRIFS